MVVDVVVTVVMLMLEYFVSFAMVYFDRTVMTAMMRTTKTIMVTVAVVVATTIATIMVTLSCLTQILQLVRTYGNDLQDDGEVNCEFRGNNACPAASTLSQMAIYRNDYDLWLTDFKAASEKMLLEGCSDCTIL